MPSIELHLNDEIQSLYLEYAKLSAEAASEIKGNPFPFQPGHTPSRLHAIEERIGHVVRKIGEIAETSQ